MGVSVFLYLVVYFLQKPLKLHGFVAPGFSTLSSAGALLHTAGWTLVLVDLKQSLAMSALQIVVGSFPLPWGISCLQQCGRKLGRHITDRKLQRRCSYGYDGASSTVLEGMGHTAGDTSFFTSETLVPWQLMRYAFHLRQLRIQLSRMRFVGFLGPWANFSGGHSHMPHTGFCRSFYGGTGYRCQVPNVCDISRGRSSLFSVNRRPDLGQLTDLPLCYIPVVLKGRLGFSQP